MDRVIRTTIRLLICALLIALSPLAQSSMAAPAGDLRAHAFRMAGDASRMRIVIEFDREPALKWFLLRAPHRLVLDLPDTRFAFASAALDPRGLVAGVRYGNVGEDHARIILAGDGPFVVERIDVLRNETSPGYRLVADIVASSERAFEQALADQAQTTASTATARSDRLGSAPRPQDRPFTIVIDPGHGGIDGGAEGANGTVEKELTLAFALQLAKALEATDRYKVVLTRDDDRFLRLDERVRIARQHEADLFISIHADTIRLKGIRGATVYTISEKASDEVARAAADRENRADSVAGIEIMEENPQVADILVDLVRRETHGFSVGFARVLVNELTGAIELIKNPHRSAGFRVLRAPDVPSVLLELGYLSNAQDEAQLNNAEWRARAVKSMLHAIGRYADALLGARG